MEQGMAMHDRALHGSQAFYAGHDPGVCARYHLAKDLWLLGHLDQSMTTLNDALRLAEELKHPMTRALTLWFAAWLHYHRQNRSGMRTSLQQLVALTTEHGISGTRELASVLLDGEEPGLNSRKLSQLDSRLQAGQWTSWQLVFCLCFLAARCRETGLVEDGLALLASISAEDREGFYAPEICRLEGELRRRLPSPNFAEIERCFGEALALARQRSARSLELHAATSLARLWLEQGRRAEARDLLEPVYSWFSEGLELPNLQDARALLDEIAHPT
jgi:predicted ATPase